MEDPRGSTPPQGPESESPGDVLARMEGLAVGQLRMEALLTEVRRDLNALAGYLGGLDQAEHADGVPGFPASPPESPASLAALGIQDLTVVRVDSGVSTATASADRGPEATHWGPEVPPSLPKQWPATVTARQDLSSSSDVRAPARAATFVKREDTNATTVGLFQELMVSVIEGGSLSKYLMVDPNSNFRSAYVFLTLLVLLHDLLLTPFTLAWDLTLEGPRLAAAWVSLCFWTVDLFMNFVTGYQKHGSLEMRMSFVALRYLKTWFLLDLLVVSSDWVGVISASTESGQAATGLRLLRFAKAGKIFRLVGLLRMMKAIKIVDEMIEKSLSDAARLTLRCFTIVCALLWVNHLFGCAWYFVGRTGVADTGMRWIDSSRSWKGEDLPFLEFDMLHQYITCLHWSVAQFTLGTMDIMAYNSMERSFNILCLALGLILSSTLVSTLSANMVEYHMREKDQVEKLRVLRRFLRENGISRGVASLVQQQARERLSVSARLQEEDVGALQILSRTLRATLRYELFKRHLCGLPLFRIWVEIDVGMVRDLCLEAVQSSILSNQDDLFLPGASTGKAYCLVSGTMAYYQEPSTAPVYRPSVRWVQDGQWLCEAALWSHWIHVGTVKARSLCQVVSLSGDAMATVFRTHPVVQVVCAEYCAAFHRSIVSARPPCSDFPNDLDVPFTDFTHLLSSMDHDFQVKISLSLLESVVGRKGASTLPQSCVAKLHDEVVRGQCSLMLGSAGQLERLVSIKVVRMESQEGKVLAELGRSHSGHPQVQARCQLPGVKQQTGEESDSSVARLLARLNLELEGVDLLRVEQSLERKDSKELRVSTQYFRTVHHMRLRGDLALPVLSSVPTSSFMQSVGADEESSAMGRTRTVMVKSELFDATVYMNTREGRCTFFAWLDQEQFDRYSTADGEKELAAVLEVLGDHEVQGSEEEDACAKFKERLRKFQQEVKNPGASGATGGAQQTATTRNIVSL